MARILSVSPEPELRTLRELVLTLSGHSVVSSSSKDDAKARMRAESFDVLVVGHRLSEPSLLALIEFFRGRNPRGCVLFIAKYDLSEELRRSVNAVIHALDGPRKVLQTITEVCGPGEDSAAA